MGKIELDRSFVARVEIAASGVSVTGQRFRARGTSLLEIGNEIMREAQRLTNSAPRKLRSSGGLLHHTGSGRARLSYDFRRSNFGETQYRSSFNVELKKINRRNAIVVSNDSPHADKVEVGTTKLSGQSHLRGSGPKGFFALPVKMSAYKRMNKNRNLPVDARRAKGWASASKENAVLRNRLWRERQKKSAKRTASSSTRITQIHPMGREQSHSFPMIGRDGRPVLMVRAVKTYSAYAIMRRAMKNVSSRLTR